MNKQPEEKMSPYQAGMEHGLDLLQNALTKCSTPEQIENQVSFVEGMAMAVLSSIVFNKAMFKSDHKFNPSILQAEISEVAEKLSDECYELRKMLDSGEVEFVKLVKEEENGNN